MAGEAERLRAVAPLCLHPSSHRLELIGARELGEPTDVLCDSDQAIDELAHAVADLRVPIFLHRLNAGSLFIEALRRALRRRGRVVCDRSPGTPYIPLDASWSEPESRFDSRRRSDLRRAERSAKRFGELSFDVVEPTASELDTTLDEAVQVEARSWKGPAGTALAHDALRRRVYRQYAAEAASRGELRLCFLRIGERTAAMQIAVEFSRRFWLLKVGYDEEFARASPGTLLALHTIRDSARRGLEGYEFLGTPDAWTRRWTHHEHPCTDVRAFPTTRRGAAAAAGDAARLVRRRVRRRIR